MTESTGTPKKKAAAKSTTKSAQTKASKAAENGVASYGRESLDNLAKAQHILADYFVEQSEVAGKFVKERFDLKATSSAGSAVDATVKGVERLTEAQKNIVDWAVEDRLAREKKPAEKKESRGFVKMPFRSLIHRGLETMLDGQQELIGLAKAQSYTALEGFTPLTRGKLSSAPSTWMHLAGQAVDNAIASQVRLLDLTTKYAKDTREMLSDKERSTLQAETAEAFERGTETTVAMQKKLLELASDQAHSTIDRFSPKDGAPVTTEEGEESRWIGTARDGIDRLTETQLKMVDRTREWVDRTFAN